MRVYVHIGVEHCGADRIQAVLEAKRDQLAGKGVLFPKSFGKKNQTRLYMALTDPDHVDVLRHNRGYGDAVRQAALTASVAQDLAAEIAAAKPETLILSASQLCTLSSISELERLRAMLAPHSDDIRILAHVDEQARVLAQVYAEQITSGRTASLAVELAMAGSTDWRGDCLAAWPALQPETNAFPEVQSPPFWLDYAALAEHWDSVFGAGSVKLRAYSPEVFASDAVIDEVTTAFDLPNIGKINAAEPQPQMSDAWLTRGRLMNADLAKLLRDGAVIPRMLWRKFIAEIAVPGAPLDPARLAPVSRVFTAANATLLKAHPALTAAGLTPAPAQPDWVEADPAFGYRSTQYLAAFLPRIEKATREARKQAKAAPQNATETKLSPSAEALMTPVALANFAKLNGGPFAPHNKLGRVNEEEIAAAYTPMRPRKPKPGSTGNVIVGCMKNEGPYIVEWVAYHRAIGIDNFIIYTNGCEDGTTEILDRLQEMGILQHRNNDAWKGNSPQQYALNQSQKEPLIRNAEWIIHIDVDEFMNIRFGNGTLPEFLEHVPDATNVAMTWRLFGHNGVTRLSSDLVIEQFDTCAPKYCPKPHTVWGFKTMFKNIGAYEKISCHRPNKLADVFRDQVKWVNGSGQPMGDKVKDNGWRSAKDNVGYDLLQLNHYALRSAESFLIKRQRGRALHVDRSIGINYWVRMDWSDHKDVTIKRNVPRVKAEVDRLLADPALKRWQDKAMDWHQAKVTELQTMPEFNELYEQALSTKLTEMERVAYALALDMES